MARIRNHFLSAAVLALTISPVACAQLPGALSSNPVPQAVPMMQYNVNSIQPETTLSINAEATASRAPDIAFLSAGVSEERKTAKEAMQAQAAAMNGLMRALENAGVEARHIQTSGLSLHPRYDYIQTKNKSGTKSGQQVLAGYVASNQVTAKVVDLDALGGTIDAMVAEGGNRLGGIRFALEDDSVVTDEVRFKAMEKAQARAKLYADAAGLTIKRIVSIDEGGTYGGMEHQVYASARMEMVADSAPTPVSGGELSYTSNVSVVYELTGN